MCYISLPVTKSYKMQWGGRQIWAAFPDYTNYYPYLTLRESLGGILFHGGQREANCVTGNSWHTMSHKLWTFREVKNGRKHCEVRQNNLLIRSWSSIHRKEKNWIWFEKERCPTLIEERSPWTENPVFWQVQILSTTTANACNSSSFKS